MLCQKTVYLLTYLIPDFEIPYATGDYYIHNFYYVLHITVPQIYTSMSTACSSIFTSGQGLAPYACPTGKY